LLGEYPNRNDNDISYDWKAFLDERYEGRDSVGGLSTFVGIDATRGHFVSSLSGLGTYIGLGTFTEIKPIRLHLELTMIEVQSLLLILY
jgi:hypothetical protein